MVVFYFVVVPLYLRRLPVLMGTWWLVVAEAILVDLPIYLWFLGQAFKNVDMNVVFPMI